MSVNEKLLDEKLEVLEKARTWSPRIISKLESHIRGADDYDLYQINPLAFAAERNVPEAEAVDLFLHATHAGLFHMNWSLMCPQCGDAVESFGSLKNLHTHFFCTLCQVGNEATLDDLIQVTFTIIPLIREIVFHKPESLSIEDYLFKYRFSRSVKTPEGTTFPVLIKQVTQITAYLEPGETRAFPLELKAGMIVGADLPNNKAFVVGLRGGTVAEPQTVACDLAKDVNPLEAAPGKITLNITNPSATRASLIVYWMPEGMQRPDLRVDPILTGKRLLGTQTFRDLFRNEVIESTEGISVRDITVLFTDLKGSTALYERIGDLKAFSLVRGHFVSCGNVITNHSGAVVKTIGDAIMATFLNPVDAVKAAIDMLTEIEAFNKSNNSMDIILKIGVHKGASIAVTLNDRLDYFGQTVNVAARVQGLADAEEIYFTTDVHGYPGVTDVLSGFDIVAKRAKIKGLQEEMNVFQVTHSSRQMA